MSENVSTESVDLRIKRSRKYLIEALFMLMQDKPFQKISVRDITEQAMVNRSTFYAHFTDKYDLFTTAIGQRMRHDLTTGLGDATGFTYANIRNLILISGNLMTKILRECKPTGIDELVPLIMTEMQNSIHAIVLKWVTDSTISKAEGNALTIFITGTIFGSVTLWGQHGYPDESIEQLADQIMPLLTAGVGHHTD